MTAFNLFPEEFPEPREQVIHERLFTGNNPETYSQQEADKLAEKKSREAFVRRYPELATPEELGVEFGQITDTF